MRRCGRVLPSFPTCPLTRCALRWKVAGTRAERLPRLPRQESSASDGPNFVFSPDGHRFAVMTVDKTVEVYDLSSLRKVEE